MNEGKRIYKAEWESPSNIALVKYWGKKGDQLPANPSISFTLDQAVSKTRFELDLSEGISPEMEFYFENERNQQFESKISGFFDKISRNYPWLKSGKLIIHSENTFPHSSGIASSASAFSALALCICTLEEKLKNSENEVFLKEASNLARLGSGSACRSVYGGFNLWGKTEAFTQSSDEYAVNIPDNEIHANFKDLTDTILIIEKGKKSVSSTAGHALLKEHPFSALRYQTGFENTTKLLEILKMGDFEAFIQLVESEALMLHALMMTSPTPFILMKPNTLAAIEKIWDFRRQTGINVLFTLDAGANIHLISTFNENHQIMDFVNQELIGFCQNETYFCNRIGKGPVNKLK